MAWESPGNSLVHIGFTDRAVTVFFGKKQIFYAHVPKTGGTYIEDLFSANGYQKKFWCTDPKKHGLRTSYQHFERSLYERCIDFPKVGFAFMTVRHPVDRMLSEYRNSGNGQDIAQWVRKVMVALTRNPYFLDNHFRPQIEFYRPAMEVIQQEQGYSSAWAQKLTEDHDLGFSVFDIGARRSTHSRRRPLTESEAGALMMFCQRYYRKDFAFFGYKPEDAQALHDIVQD